MDNQQLWQAVLGELELSLSKANFTTWFKNTCVSAKEGGKVIISVPNTFTQTWLQKKYHSSILKALHSVSNNEIREAIYKVESIKPDQRPMFANNKVVAQPAIQNSAPVEPTNSSSLNNEYVFNKFVVGKGNELAHAACLAVAQQPGQTYNPLFIYGGVGLGKTHLLQAVGLKTLEQNPNAKILYVTCEKFTNDFIKAVRGGNVNSFKEVYRKIDVLLIDDIQFLAGKERTQEEFFHTFNELHQANKQIVITSDRPPKAIATLEQRLLSRFEWGMIADINTPDLETRIAILEAKCQEKNFDIENNVLNFIATSIQNNVRELEGALNRIIAYYQLNNVTPTLENTKHIISTLTNNYQKRSITPKQLINTVSGFFDVPLESLRGSSRKKELVVPRQITMYLLREELKYSYPAIGQELGGRDHTTAMHACSKIGGAIENDEKVRQDIHLIKQKLYNA